ncbi:permease [Siccirubricoccus phaeus]|uniref:permease n=1 Tax=Siccirubricoccus phaeus TaxID=2595053 RepID=UPI0011F3CD5D|nr:permease [Siccirubricoccus phaeus]
MTPGQILLLAAAAIAFGFTLRRGVPTAQRALRETGETVVRVLPLLALALPMAAFLAELIPADIGAGWLGPESGLPGLVIASLAGGFIPGGPFVSFPLVLTFMKAGAGGPQMVALISGWAILGFHRVIAWEWPVLGPRFIIIRLIASLALPVLAGLLAELLLPSFPHALVRP